MMIAFGEWTPDLDDLSSKGLTEAKNVFPLADGYEHMHSLQSATNALPAACIGAAWFKDSTGTVRLYAGTATTLQSLSGATWTDVSLGAGYTGAVNWEFAQFGDRVIAVDVNQVPQYFDMPTSTDFAALTGSPPQAARIAIVGDHVVLGDLTISAVDYPHWVAWSGFNNSTLWTPSAATMADRQELFGRGGRVQKIVGGNIGVVFQENAIRLMTPVGPPLIFRFDEVERVRGTQAPNSVVSVGQNVFFYAQDGFSVYTIGGTVQQIGDNRVNRWFLANCPDVSTLRGVADRASQRILWAFSAGSSTNDKIIVYDWSINRWSYGELNTEVLLEYATPGYTLDSMDTLIPDIDAATVSFDSASYKGGQIVVAAVDSSHKVATFTGTPLDATLETGELAGESRLFVNRLRPVVTGYGTLTAQSASRSTRASDASWTGVSTLNSAGEFTMRANARYHKFRLNLSGGFTRAMGLDVTAIGEGDR